MKTASLVALRIRLGEFRRVPALARLPTDQASRQTLRSNLQWLRFLERIDLESQLAVTGIAEDNYVPPARVLMVLDAEISEGSLLNLRANNTVSTSTAEIGVSKVRMACCGGSVCEIWVDISTAAAADGCWAIATARWC